MTFDDLLKKIDVKIDEIVEMDGWQEMADGANQIKQLVMKWIEDNSETNNG